MAPPRWPSPRSWQSGSRWRFTIFVHRATARESVAERERVNLGGCSRAAGPICSLRLCFRPSVVPTSNGRDERKPGSATRLMDIVDREENMRLARLIDDLLDMARVRSGQLVLDLEYVDLCGVLQDVTTRMSMEAERAGCTLQVDAAASLRRSLGPGAAGPSGHEPSWQRHQVRRASANHHLRELVPRRLDRSALRDRPRRGNRALEQQQQIFEPFKRAAGPNRYKGLGLGPLSSATS